MDGRHLLGAHRLGADGHTAIADPTVSADAGSGHAQGRGPPYRGPRHSSEAFLPRPEPPARRSATMSKNCKFEPSVTAPQARATAARWPHSSGISPCRTGLPSLFPGGPTFTAHPYTGDIKGLCGHQWLPRTSVLSPDNPMNLHNNGQWSLTKFGIGQPVLRSEDPVLVRGEGRFTDDVSLPRQAYAVIVRSRHAHGILRGIATDAARQ